MRKTSYDELVRTRLTETEAGRPENRFPLILILDNIRSLYNVGAMFRTADGARLEAIYTSGYTPHPPRAEIAKTALGATNTVPHQHFATVGEAIRAARSEGLKIAALELAADARSIYSLESTDFPLAIVVGNEISGVSVEAMEQIDVALAIPMLGAKHSLNVAVAAGIAIYECVRVFAGKLDRFRP